MLGKECGGEVLLFAEIRWDGGDGVGQACSWDPKTKQILLNTRSTGIYSSSEGIGES